MLVHLCLRSSDIYVLGVVTKQLGLFIFVLQLMIMKIKIISTYLSAHLHLPCRTRKGKTEKINIFTLRFSLRDSLLRLVSSNLNC